MDNAAGVLSSEPPEAGLTHLGRKQAEAALAALRVEPVTAVWDLPVRRDHGLIEYGISALERSSGSAAGRASQDALRRWIVDAPSAPASPRGERGVAPCRTEPWSRPE